MYFIIEYVDTCDGAGEALAWEFAKTDDEATIKARAHFLLFKDRFAAQGYRILSPAGLAIACGPEGPEHGRGRYRRGEAPLFPWKIPELDKQPLTVGIHNQVGSFWVSLTSVNGRCWQWPHGP